MTNYSKLIARNIIYIILGVGVSTILIYLLRFYLARKLGVEEYGLFFAVYAFSLFICSIVSIGLNPALSRYLHDFKDDEGKRKGFIIITAVTQLTISLIAFIVIFILKNFLTVNYFKYPSGANMIVIMGLFMLALIIVNLAETLYNTYHKQQYRAGMMILINMFILITSVLLISLGALAPAIAYLSANAVLGIIFCWIFIKKYFPNFFAVKAKFNTKEIKSFYGFGFAVLFTAIGSMLLTTIDTLLLTHLTDLEAVGLYNVAVPIAGVMDMLVLPFMIMLYPLIAELHSNKNFETLRQIINKIYKISVLLIFPATVVIISYPEVILRTLFGNMFIGAAIALQILVVAKIFSLLGVINSQIISGSGNPKTYTYIVLIGATLNVILNFLFISKYGIAGAAFATLISYALIFILSFISVKKIISYFAIPITTILKSFLASMIMLGAIILLKKFISANAWLELVIVLAIACIVYSIAIVVLRVMPLKEAKDTIKIFSKAIMK